MRLISLPARSALDLACCYRIGLVVVSLAATCSVEAGEIRGAIEIGAKGVKATVVEVGDKPGEPSAKVLMTQVINTTISSGVATTKKYGADAIKDTAEAAGTIARRMRDEFKVADDKIRVFGSSGLPKATNSQEMVDALKAATGLTAMEFITPNREVELTIRGLLSPEKQKTALLIDIGSGNTKGGLIETDGSLAPFSIPQGSVTFADRAAKAAAGKPFAESADEQRSILLDAPLTEQVKGYPQLTTRPLVYLNGGAAYSMATLLHPEAAKQEEVTLSAADIVKYLQWLKAEVRIPSPDLSAIADPEIKAAASKEIDNVHDNFTRENLIAGAEILTSLSSVFHFEGKVLTFNRLGLTALVRAPLDQPASPIAPVVPAPVVVAEVVPPVTPMPPTIPPVTAVAAAVPAVVEPTAAKVVIPSPPEPVELKSPPVPTKTLPVAVPPGV